MATQAFGNANNDVLESHCAVGSVIPYCRSCVFGSSRASQKPKKWRHVLTDHRGQTIAQYAKGSLAGPRMLENDRLMGSEVHRLLRYMNTP